MTRATGEHFNIFRILAIGHREVTTHSPMLAELLSPKGNHGQGAIFLRLFLTEIKIQNFDAEGAKLKTEDFRGQVTEDSGGRFDIVVKDRCGVTIVIENKIHAADQPTQMKRCRKEYPDAKMFYLTLDGRNPCGLSDADVKSIECIPISYKDHILAWLKKCREAAACLPSVRETITQYIHLIEELTNQSTNIRMSKALIDEIIKSPESLQAFYTLRDAELAVQTELFAGLAGKLDKIVKHFEHSGMKWQASLREMHKEGASFYFTTRGLEKCNLQILFHFSQKDFKGFLFGFAKINPKQECRVEAQILSAFKEHFTNGRRTDWCPAIAYWEEYMNWGPKQFEAIQSQSNQFAEGLKAKLDKLTEIARQICPD
jgi:hypothetical protein